MNINQSKMLKKIQTILTAAFLMIIPGFFLTGCKKFLEQEPSNRISVNDIFKDFEGARTTLIGTYDNLKEVDYYGRSIGLYADLTGGNIKYARSNDPAYLRTYNFSNSSIADQNDLQGFYLVGYNTIYRANAVFENISKVADANQLQINRMLADAYTFRALSHFELVRVFAQPYNFTADASHPGIIIRTKNTSADEPAGEISTVKQVYDQIVADFDSAIALYPNSVSIYAGGDARSYFSLDAAKAFLARVHLYRNDWAKAITLCNEVITAGYPLTSNLNYVNGWRRNGGKQMDNEAIFYLYARIDVNQGAFGDNFNPGNNIFGYMAASNDLLNIFGPGDVRGTGTMFLQAPVSGINYFFTKKYQGRNDSSDNQKLIRSSELYLIRSEAQAESDNLTGALADLNRIRQRANPVAPALTLTDKQQLLDSIFVERRRELCFEGHFLFDITRKKKNLVRADCIGTNCSVAYPSALFAVPRPVER